MKNTLLKLAALIVLTSVFKDTLAADTASGSSVLPYETWLKTIQKSLTGPVAFSVSLIGIVSCGATLIFTGGEMGRFMRSIVYLVIGLADFIYQKHKFNEDMKMTKQEVKDEYKNTEGDPQIKGRQRRKMQEVSQKRMMQDVPKADVVITNPTHFAVALKYEAKVSSAPVVLAKGEDYLAQKIKEVARENKIEIVENKPLARMLYHNVDVGAEIPPELYQAVAEVLAAVYKAKNIQ